MPARLIDADMSDTYLRAAIEAVLIRTPEWVRNDFASKDDAVRARAQEALAAMIEAALVP
jgi:hypothetical protein